MPPRCQENADIPDPDMPYVQARKHPTAVFLFRILRHNLTAAEYRQPEDAEVCVPRQLQRHQMPLPSDPYFLSSPDRDSPSACSAPSVPNGYGSATDLQMYRSGRLTSSA